MSAMIDLSIGSPLRHRLWVRAKQVASGWGTCDAYERFGVMQLGRAIEERPFADAPTRTQRERGMTPELADDAMSAVAESLIAYAEEHLRELLRAADAFGVAVEVTESLRATLDAS